MKHRLAMQRIEMSTALAVPSRIIVARMKGCEIDISTRIPRCTVCGAMTAPIRASIRNSVSKVRVPPCRTPSRISSAAA